MKVGDYYKQNPQGRDIAYENLKKSHNRVRKEILKDRHTSLEIYKLASVLNSIYYPDEKALKSSLGAFATNFSSLISKIYENITNKKLSNDFNIGNEKYSVYNQRNNITLKKALKQYENNIKEGNTQSHILVSSILKLMKDLQSNITVTALGKRSYDAYNKELEACVQKAGLILSEYLGDPIKSGNNPSDTSIKIADLENFFTYKKNEFNQSDFYFAQTNTSGKSYKISEKYDGYDVYNKLSALHNTLISGKALSTTEYGDIFEYSIQFLDEITKIGIQDGTDASVAQIEKNIKGISKSIVKNNFGSRRMRENLSLGINLSILEKDSFKVTYKKRETDKKETTKTILQVPGTNLMIPVSIDWDPYSLRQMKMDLRLEGDIFNMHISDRPFRVSAKNESGNTVNLSETNIAAAIVRTHNETLLQTYESVLQDDRMAGYESKNAPSDVLYMAHSFAELSLMADIIMGYNQRGYKIDAKGKMSLDSISDTSADTLIVNSRKYKKVIVLNIADIIKNAIGNKNKNNSYQLKMNGYDIDELEMTAYNLFEIKNSQKGENSKDRRAAITKIYHEALTGYLAQKQVDIKLKI